jgi:hypothetical protein
VAMPYSGNKLRPTQKSIPACTGKVNIDLDDRHHFLVIFDELTTSSSRPLQSGMAPFRGTRQLGENAGVPYERF